MSICLLAFFHICVMICCIKILLCNFVKTKSYTINLFLYILATKKEFSNYYNAKVIELKITWLIISSIHHSKILHTSTSALLSFGSNRPLDLPLLRALACLIYNTTLFEGAPQRYNPCILFVLIQPTKLRSFTHFTEPLSDKLSLCR